jgi:two-component system response regulator HydG
MSRPAWLAPALLATGLVPVALVIYACAAGPSSTWLSLFPFSCALSAAGLAARSAWRSPTAATQALALSLLLALVPVVALLWPDTLGRAGVALATVGAALAAALGLASAWHFPTPRTISRSSSAAIVGLTLGAAALGAFGWTMGGDSPLFLAAPLGLTALFSLFAGLVLLYTAARAERASARMSARWALIGLSLAMLLAFAAGLWAFLDLHAAGAPAGTLLALSLVPLAWAGHQALGGLHPRDLPQAARRALATFLGIGVVGSLAALLTWAAGGPPGSWVTVAAVACGAALAVAPLRGRIETLLRRRSSREIQRLRGITQEVTRLVRKPVGRAELQGALAELRDACAANRITLLMPGGDRIEKSAEGLPPGPRRVWSETVANALQSVGGPIFVDDPAGEAAFATIRQLTADREAAGYVSLLVGQEVRGILVFSHKEWGRRYDVEEIDLLGVAGYALARLLPAPPARNAPEEKTSQEKEPKPALPAKLDRSPLLPALGAPSPGPPLAPEPTLPPRIPPSPATARVPPQFAAPVVFAESEAMRHTLDELGARAPQSRALLLCGERGSGRELLARHVHATTQAQAPFARWNVCGLPDLEAARALNELAAQARGGTLYLEPVEVLGPLAQVALLDIIGEAEGPRVVAAITPGSQESSPLSPDLRRALGMAVPIPPLRERVADIPLLAAQLLQRISDGYPPPPLSSEALEVLCAYSWPGNVPELRAVLERAAALAGGGPLGDRDLMLSPAPADDPYAGTFADIEHRALTEALRRAGGNKSLAARRLGLKRTTFLEKLKRTEERASPPRPPGDGPVDKG